MSDDAKGKSKEAAPAAAADAASGAKKGPPLKTIVVVLVLLAVEAAAILGALTMFAKPAEVKAVNLDEHADASEDKTVEVPIITESFTNNASGRLWIWKVEVFAVVKKRHAGEPADAAAAKGDGHGGGDHGKAKDAHGGSGGHGGRAPAMTVREELDARKAEIRTGIGAIFSAAQHSYFTEPGRETISRQILEYLRQVFGQDEAGEERIQRVLIPNCIGQAIDS